MQRGKVILLLWFDADLNEVVHYYISVFPKARIDRRGTGRPRVK